MYGQQPPTWLIVLVMLSIPFVIVGSGLLAAWLLIRLTEKCEPEP